METQTIAKCMKKRITIRFVICKCHMLGAFPVVTKYFCLLLDSVGNETFLQYL